MSKKVKTKPKIAATKKPLKSKVEKAVVSKKQGKATKTISKKSAKPKKELKKTLSKNTITSKNKVKAKSAVKPVAKVAKEKMKKNLPVAKIKAPAKAAKKEIIKKVVEKPINAIASDKPKKPSRRKGGRKPKNKGDDDEPEIIDDILVEQLINSTKKLRNQPKKPKKLQTFVNPITSLTVAAIDNAHKSKVPAKEPKGKFELEYVVRTSTGILYEFLTTPSGLSEWFADDVNIQDGIFTFMWDGSEQKARLLGFKNEQFIRFQWMDKPEGSYFEFRIQIDEITGDIALIIIDFADEASDLETSKRLWDSQIDKLLHVLGSY
jgi:uncharacterized protein YndB with AHSA1/START domain